MKEIWKDVLGYEGLYQVSNLGRVKSLGNNKTRKEKLMSLCNDKDGYLLVSLSKNGIRIIRKAHQLVAEAFLNHNRYNNLVINHINFIKNDNRLENLEIVSIRENSNLKHIKSSSKYVGVHWNKAKSKWISQIVIDGKQKYLGQFEDEIDAHNAYQIALSKIK